MVAKTKLIRSELSELRTTCAAFLTLRGAMEGRASLDEVRYNLEKDIKEMEAKVAELGSVQVSGEWDSFVTHFVSRL